VEKRPTYKIEIVGKEGRRDKKEGWVKRVQERMDTAEIGKSRKGENRGDE